MQDMQTEKVHVGDIDIECKMFGNGEPVLLISGSGNVMGVWPSYIYKNYQKIIK